MSNLTISKSQYMRGLQCPKSLWFFHNRKDIAPKVLSPETQARFDTGNEIGKLAMCYFSGGVEVDKECSDIARAAKSTNQHISAGKDIIFEATAIHPRDGSYCRIDILRKSSGSTDEWDMIEVKSSTKPKEEHYDELAFQYRVFSAAGYKIRTCQVMLVNNEYVKQGDIDPHHLFYLYDITGKVLQREAETENSVTNIIKAKNGNHEPDITIGSRCNFPYECDYKVHCWAEVPPYSIYDAFTAKKADKIAQEHGTSDIRNLPADVRPSGVKVVDIECYLLEKEHFEQKEVAKFLAGLQYPLYFLDYETICPAVPLFDGTRPYQQVPFQFSLHRQDSLGCNLSHIEYLHKDKNDPRLEFVKKLITACGDEGSVVVYNKGFEEKRNSELAEYFPQYENELLAINDRMVDLLVPFRQRMLYNPVQQGSASLKYVLPAFTDMNYDNMAIGSGTDASLGYECFMKGKLTGEDLESLWESLSGYCEVDTLGMVKLLEVLQKYSN